MTGRIRISHLDSRYQNLNGDTVGFSKIFQSFAKFIPRDFSLGNISEIHDCGLHDIVTYQITSYDFKCKPLSI